MHVAKVLYDLDQEAVGLKVKRPRKQCNQQRDTAILAIVEAYPNVRDKRKYLERVARFTSSIMKL